jgi:prophage maintenance system killer protein
MAQTSTARTLTRPKWRDVKALVAMHGSLAAEHGLREGQGRRPLDESLAGPRRLVTEGVTDAHRLAASYCAGIAGARPFLDGNAALALAAAYVVLRLGGTRLDAPEHEAVAVIRDLEAGEIGEAELEAWMAKNSAPA